MQCQVAEAAEAPEAPSAATAQEAEVQLGALNLWRCRHSGRAHSGRACSKRNAKGNFLQRLLSNLCLGMH